MKKLFLWMCCAAVWGVCASMSPAFAQGTAFTYQGRLNSNGSPVTGLYDLRFALYTNSSSGSAVFGPLTNAATAVSNGLFMATLDFGAGVFNGTAYWLDIAARTNGNSAFSALAPRQEITPSPYALYAPSAAMAASAGSVAAANITGTISVSQLSSAVVTNNEANVALSGTFTGNGSGLANIPLSGLASYGSLKLTTNGFGLALVASPAVGLQPTFVDAVTNLNGAGHVDLVCANFGTDTITVLTNNGGGQFSTETTVLVSTNPFWVAVTDVNNDGRLDLVCSYFNPNTPTNILTVLTNNGAGGFGFNATLIVGPNPTCVIAADVNGDGKPDLVTANLGTNTLTALTNNGHGGFVLSTTLRVGTSPVEVVAADFIGNGKQDLVCANYGTNTLSVLINNGNGTFLPTTYTVGNSPRSVLACDVNGDGLVDLVCANQGDISLSVLTNNGDGTFTAANTITNLGVVTINNLAAADLDGDGRLDLIIANSVGLQILLNTGNATFAAPILLTPNEPSGGFFDVVAADVNGDGKPDLVATAFGGSVLAELINVTGEPSTALTMANQSGGLLFEVGVNGAPNIIGGWGSNSIALGVSGSVIGGGGLGTNINSIYSDQSCISGGNGNSILTSATGSSIGGGQGNTIQTGAASSFIGGGSQNTVSSNADSVVVGGTQNTSSGLASFVGGGIMNLAGGSYSVVAGGQYNTNTGFVGTISGGQSNNAQVYGATIGGGQGNTAGHFFATVSGGYQNFVGGEYSAIGGGNNNVNYSTAGTIAGGQGNTILANGPVNQGTIGGGYSNYVANSYATVPGGSQNYAGGLFSFAAGNQAQAQFSGDFVWADSQNTPFTSTAPDQFLVRAQGGVGINTNNPNGAALYVLGNRTNGAQGSLSFFENTSTAANAGPALRAVVDGGRTPDGALSVAARVPAGTPSSIIAEFGNSASYVVVITNDGTIYSKGVALSSDRNLKENFTRLDAATVLAKVAAMPVNQWNYKEDSAQTRHIGPVAQDFHAAFGLNGNDDTHISAADEGGVALAAIQGLNQKLEAGTKSKDAELADLKRQVAELKVLVKRLTVTTQLPTMPP